LSALTRKRTNINGAALFWTLPPARDLRLLRALVAYQVLIDFLDDIDEHSAVTGHVDGCQLHLALIDAVDLNRPIANYYRYHPWQNDGGYAQALVKACRENCSQLPSYEGVRVALAAEAARTRCALGVNHEPEPVLRDAALRGYAEKMDDLHEGLAWFEIAAAASGMLVIHALLALAAESACNPWEVTRVRGIYFPWAAAATTMLDSYVDQSDDAASGHHSYIAHYATPHVALQRIRWLIARSLTEARALPGGERHALIVASMVAMYLSKDNAHSNATSVRAGPMVVADSLVKLLLPTLRLWRIATGLRAA
jgi:tetraprenyl-beta-curcumene synthase